MRAGEKKKKKSRCFSEQPLAGFVPGEVRTSSEPELCSANGAEVRLGGGGGLICFLGLNTSAKAQGLNRMVDAESEDAAQHLPSCCSVLPFSQSARLSGKPHKEVKNLLHSSAAGIDLCQGKKDSSPHLFSVKVGQSTPFLYPLSTYFIYVDCKHHGVMILF